MATTQTTPTFAVDTSKGLQEVQAVHQTSMSFLDKIFNIITLPLLTLTAYTCLVFGPLLIIQGNVLIGIFVLVVGIPIFLIWAQIIKNLKAVN